MNIPKKIINEVAEKMLDNRIEMEDIAIVPNIFVIYLHREDQAEIKFLFNRLREQIVLRLNKEVEKRGKDKQKISRGWTKILEFLIGSGFADHRLPIDVPDEWDISFQATEKDILVGENVFEISKGEVCVVSSFSEVGSQVSELKSQFKTFVTIYAANGGKSGNYEVKATAQPARDAELPGAKTESASEVASAHVIARLTCKYNGANETETFAIEEKTFTIGRGNDCDLVLSKASDRISRKHLEITFEEGRFYLKSFGVYGTTLQGKPVPISEKVIENTMQKLNKKVAMPDNARIALAGGEVLLDFSKITE